MSAATAAPADAGALEERMTGATAKPTEYTLGVNLATIDRLLRWAESEDDLDSEEVAAAFPLMQAPDVAIVGNHAGHTRKQACEAWLDQPPTAGDRHAWLKRADDAGVKIVFVVIPTSYIGEHTVESEVITTKRRKG